MLAAAAGLVAGGTALWHYNRGNFLYDRKLRQEQEFTIFEWRKAHAELWREDVRDIIEMTEKKMDNYLIISVLELGMCAGLFACGRLEPGTPPWLLQLYMLTLGGAFTYLLMAVWFAMHATVAAQCTSVRMLTQFVRLPIPSWKDFESARTYAQQFESLRVEDMLRVPMMRSMATGDQPATHTIAQGPGYEDWLQDSELPSMASDSEDDDDDDEQDNHPDPWRLEKDGDGGLYELRSMPVELRRHILLARYAALQFQCYDAFSRLAMSFGTHQLLFALAHYCLGYLSIQDGSHWPAWAVSFIMMSVSAMMMYVDFSMTRWEQFGITLVVFAGLCSGTTAVHIWILKGSAGSAQLTYILPVAYSAHCAWLLLTLRACGLQETGSGAILPLKFRAVLYLDVFGWLTRSPAHESILSPKAAQPVHSMMPSCCSSSCKQKDDYNEPCSEPSPIAEAAAGLRRNILQRIFGRRHRESCKSAWVSAASRGRVGNGQYDPVPPGDSAVSGPGGEIQYPPEDAFESQTYQDPGLDDEFRRMYGETDIVTGGDKLGGPAKAPARLFGGATKMLVALWAIALALPLEFFKQLLAHPLLADVYLESLDPETGLVGEQKEVHAVIGTDINGLPELIPVFSAPARQIPALEGGVPLEVKWPAHSAFVPRALSSDPAGQYLIVADDFGLFSASMRDLPRKLLNATTQGGAEVVHPEQTVAFDTSPRCDPLEGLTFTDAAITCDSGLGGEGGPDSQNCVALVLHAEDKAATITTCPFTRGGSASKVPARQWTIGTQWLEDRESIASLSVRSPCERGAQVGPKSCLSVGTTLGRVVELWSPQEDDWVEGGYMVPRRVVIERNISSLSGSLVDMPGDVIGALWWRQNTLDLLDADNKEIGQWRLPSHSTWLMMAGGGKSLYALGLRKPKSKTETPKAEEVAKVKAELKRLKHEKAKEPDQAWVELWHFPAPAELQEYWRRMADPSSNGEDAHRQLAEL
eukprot:CAMPEP_0206568966 /NCGR_PEP_ID=MMETSP0325_2-20121206/26153_1 /ASSEMBLY_ACC=CAM_ASM_000347 /TAXON_ID=2866 /ORGANISM="Crypthecodinium cohnii, Strain Seligo" /LENGTH=980 /DNA_ID=CAMNT_0054072457 /DNA_START=106 /DNA_END=3049 /DNA_ORIENTATION=-